MHFWIDSNGNLCDRSDCDAMLELNKLYCENCLDTMSRMPDNFIDLTVTSPPYDKLRDYKGYSFDFESIAKELYRVTKKGGVVVWVVGDATINGSETGTSFRQALYFMEIGFDLYDTMIYQKHSAFPTNVRYSQDFEYMFVLSNGKPKSFNPIMKFTSRNLNNRTKPELSKDRTKSGELIKKIIKPGDECVIPNIWNFEIAINHSQDKKTGHPAVFPEKLAQDHIKSWSSETDIVYDPFSGSGTTAKMAHLLKRRWIGSETSQEYVDLANKRLWPYLNQKTIFD